MGEKKNKGCIFKQLVSIGSKILTNASEKLNYLLLCILFYCRTRHLPEGTCACFTSAWELPIKTHISSTFIQQAISVNSNLDYRCAITFIPCYNLTLFSWISGCSQVRNPHMLSCCFEQPLLKHYQMSQHPCDDDVVPAMSVLAGEVAAVTVYWVWRS